MFAELDKLRSGWQLELLGVDPGARWGREYGATLRDTRAGRQRTQAEPRPGLDLSPRGLPLYPALAGSWSDRGPAPLTAARSLRRY